VSFHQEIHARPVISANNERQSSLSAPLALRDHLHRAADAVQAAAQNTREGSGLSSYPRPHRAESEIPSFGKLRTGSAVRLRSIP
jgi:hypothetical protein